MPKVIALSELTARGCGGEVPAAVRDILAPDLEPTSFDDLPLGGEWTTRRRTISESDIALFAAVAGDFSPLAVDATVGGGRLAAPALVVAVAMGLGSMDMPLPAIAEWEWANWKFPRPIRAGDTVYARWALTQKRPTTGGSATAVAVWRVDVHTADGALCAAGEVGASVKRHPAAAPPRAPAPAPAPAPARPKEQPRAREAARPKEPAAAATSPSRRRRHHRATPAAGAAKPAGQQEAHVAEPTAAPPPEAAATGSVERTGTRRRRRRRSSGSQSARNGEPQPPAAASAAPAASQAGGDPSSPASAPVASASSVAPANRISRVIRRLRGT